MNIVVFIIIALYAGLLTFILLYSFVQASLVINYRRFHSASSVKHKDAPPPQAKLPTVTIQLPIYNEKYVVDRLLDAVGSINYPLDKMEIQVLDDSTDETVEFTKWKVKQLIEKGIDVSYIHRTDRIGYKAGALDEGLNMAKGEFIAIFDADFIPKSDFLELTIPHFQDSEIGVVQTRWEHINRKYSLLTRMQAFGLDAHFSIEQTGRNAGGHFINFNGTAGIWRKSCIEDAGGWSAETLTEDLDLSYRAQLKGWKFKYLENVGSPAELPAVIDALKTQQFRWTKGAAECARKNLPKVLRSKKIGITTKVHALFHLMNSFLFVCIALTALLSIPMLFIKELHPDLDRLFKLGSVFLISLVILTWFYAEAYFRNIENKLRHTFNFIALFPCFLAVSMGMSVHNSIAVIEGYMGRKSPFIRTPKLNVVSSADDWSTNKYLGSKIGVVSIIEGVLMLYFIGGILLGLYYGNYGLMPFHIMLVFGFGYVFISTITQSYTIRKRYRPKIESKTIRL